MNIDSTFFIYIIIAVALLLLLRAVWTVVVAVLGLVVAGIILLFVLDALSGGTAISQVIDSLINQLVPLLGATGVLSGVWLRRVKPQTETFKYS